MSNIILQRPMLIVTSYCGPADSPEQTRMRVQVEVPLPSGLTSLGYNAVLALHDALGQWLHEREQERKP